MFLTDSFTAKMRSIFTKILMSERITATEWRSEIQRVSALANELTHVDRRVKVQPHLLSAHIAS